MLKKRIRFAIPLILCLVLVVTALAAVACGGEKGKTGVTVPGKDTIVIGQVRSLTGPYAFYEANAFGPSRELWLEEVNAAGGIYIEDYGKKMKVEMKIYDDGTNLDTMTQLYEKLMTEDKVDFIFGPNSTAYNFAAAGIANQHGYLMMTCEGGDRTLESQIKDLPLFFGVLNYSTTEVPALIEIFKEQGVKTVAIAYNDDLHGIEYKDAMVEGAAAAGIEVVYNEAFPYETADFSNIIRQVQALNPDCFYFPGYPEHNFPMVPQLIQAGYNPKMLVLGPGGTFGAFPYAMGGASGPEYGYQIVNGVCGYGAWSIHTSPALAELREKMLNSPALKALKFTEANMDYWGHAFYYAELQMFQQALEKAGSLDNAEVAQVLKDNHFETVLGDTYFDNQILAAACNPGEIGQWQNGVFEVIDVGAKRTAAPIYPKPAWPTAPPAAPAATATTVDP
jgi:branched-chain amino acid transport system substrate-binding protein